MKPLKVASEPTAMSPADEARAWIERLIRNAAECNAENEANPVGEEMCPPTHYSAIVRLKPLPDGRASVYEPGVEVTPDRLQAFLDEHDSVCAEAQRLRDENKRQAMSLRAWKGSAEAAREGEARLHAHAVRLTGEVEQLQSELAIAREDAARGT